MSLNIKTATGLQEIGKVTKEKVVSALGFEPANKSVEATVAENTSNIIKADAALAAHETNTRVHVTTAEKQKWDNKSEVRNYADLQNAPNIVETDEGEFILADEAGNIAVKVDKDGLATKNINVSNIRLGGDDLNQKLAGLAADVEAFKLPSIVDDGSGKLEFADEAGNIIARLGAQGFETKTVIVDGTDIKNRVESHIQDSMHLLPGERDKWDAKSDFSGDFDDLKNSPVTEDDSGKLEYTDEAGNIIARLDDKGFETTTVTAKTAIIVDGLNVKNAITEHVGDDTHLKSGERDKWNAKSEFSGKFDDLQNSPITQDETNNIAITDEAGNIILSVGELEEGDCGLETTKVILNNAGTRTDIGEELRGLATNKADNTDVHVEEISVELGTDGTVGGYKTGDVIAAGTDIKTILNKLFQKAVPATYTKPTLTLAAKDTAAGSYEYGTNITAQVAASFTKNDAGALTTIAILKDGVEILNGTDNPLTSTAETISLTTTVSYTASATYAEGTIKNNNLGEPSPDGHISAGSITSSAVKFTPYRCGYFYGVLDTDNSTALTSDIIRSGTKKTGAYAAGNLPLIKASSVANRKRIFVACPATNKGVTKVIMPSAVNADCTANFVKQATTVSVEGANGSAGIDYNVWVYEPAEISDDQTFTVTLG